MEDLEPSENRNKLILFILRILCFSVFAGRAWEHIRWSPPFRSILWDQQLLEPFVTKFTSYTWTEYATSSTVDQWIDNIIITFGIFYAVCAISSLVIKKESVYYRLHKGILYAGAVSLILLSFLNCSDRFYQVGQFLEYTSQFSSPVLLILTITQFKEKIMTVLMQLAIALTFTCHGLYALGYYPTPGNWIDMVIMSLNLTDKQSVLLLQIAGIMDIVISIAIFNPYLRIPALIYATVWGFITSFARFYANYSYDYLLGNLQQNLHEVFFRIPHFGLPFIVILLLADQKYLRKLSNIFPLLLGFQNKGGMRSSSNIFKS